VEKVAVIGSGIAGLGSAWLLRHQYEIHLFESGSYDGSHSNTVFVDEGDRAFLHSDSQLMPCSRRVWSAWNYLADTRNMMTDSVSVTYWMNLLQNIDTRQNYFVSLNPLQEPKNIHASMTCDHPVFDRDAMAAQPRLATIKGRQRTWFCGSYFGYGFHEDALASAVEVASLLGVTAPWQSTHGIEAA
jgi:predicted NAD/FAD-binding protein